MAQVSINGSVVVGRSRTCDVVVKHMSVSNRHCQIGVEGDEDPPRCYVKDLSSNGTWIRRKTGDEEGHLKAEKGATFTLSSGDVILLLPPTHADCFAFQLRVSWNPIFKRCSLTFDTRNPTNITERTERPGVVEEDGRRIPKRCEEQDLVRIRESMESLRSVVEEGVVKTRLLGDQMLCAVDGQSGEEHVSNHGKDESHDVRKEQRVNVALATSSIITSTATSAALATPSIITSTATSAALATPFIITSTATSAALATPSIITPTATSAALATPSIITSTATSAALATPSIITSTATSAALATPSIITSTATSAALATPSIITSTATSAVLATPSIITCTNDNEPFKVEGLGHTPRDGTTPPGDPPTLASAEVGEKECCPLCGFSFPLSILVDHCESCSRDGAGRRGPLLTTPPPPSTAPTSLRPTVSLEQCPTCGSMFSLTELIPHWEVCSKKGAVCDEDGVEQCLHCLKDYLLTDLVEHVKMCPMKDKKCLEEEQCAHCLNIFPLNELVEHTLTCAGYHTSGGSQGPLERCMHCFKDFPLSSLIHHTAGCAEGLSGPKDRFKGFVPSVHDLDATAMVVLNDTQRQAVDYVIERSRADSDRVYPSLVRRACALGYLEKDVQRTLHWIQNEAPIIIHVRLERVLGFLVKDTHYRNQFETRTSGGSTDLGARRSWEDNIFNKIYASSLSFDRVKYGVLNIVGDPCGVRSCYHYGDSFLQLKKVRLRTTFASMDTSSSAVKLSCCEHYGNVLYEYTDPELKAIIDVATRRVSSMKSDMIANYKEVQIHGPVCLSENVECVVANNRHHGDASIEALLEEFVKRNGCNLIWMDPDDHHPSSSLASIATLPHTTTHHQTRRHRKRRRRDYYDDY